MNTVLLWALLYTTSDWVCLGSSKATSCEVRDRVQIPSPATLTIILDRLLTEPSPTLFIGLYLLNFLSPASLARLL